MPWMLSWAAAAPSEQPVVTNRLMSPHHEQRSTDAGRPWLIVDCYTSGDGAANFVPYFDNQAVTVAAARSTLPLSPLSFRGVLITGSAAGVNDRLPWVHSVVQFTRRCLEQRVPVLGVCFGHQALAEAAIGPGAIRRSPHPEVGWYGIAIQRPHPLLHGFPSSFRTFLSHFDEVRPEAGGHLDVFASSNRCPIQAFGVPGRPAWGVQFHAEMRAPETTQIVHRYVGTRLSGDPVRTLCRATDSTDLVRRLVYNFQHCAS